MNTMIICGTVIIGLLIVGVSIIAMMSVYLNAQKEIVRESYDRLERFTCDVIKGIENMLIKLENM